MLLLDFITCVIMESFEPSIKLIWCDICGHVYNTLRYTCFLLHHSPSCTETLPPAWNERYGVHQGYPHPEDQSGTGLRAEGADQRAGKGPLNTLNNDNVRIPFLQIFVAVKWMKTWSWISISVSKFTPLLQTCMYVSKGHLDNLDNGLS